MSSDDNNSNSVAPNADGDGIDLSLLSLVSKTVTASGSRCLALNSSTPSVRGGSPFTLAEDTVADLFEEVVAVVIGFLPPKDIMSAARVCETWSDAAMKIVVDKMEDLIFSYNAMSVDALPNIQSLDIFDPRNGFKYADGEDPDEKEAASARNVDVDCIPHDISFIPIFRQLRRLDIYHVPLNGRYPYLFNFPLLEELSIQECSFLKWDLEMLSGCPLLKELYCHESPTPTGDLSDLRVLKNTLEKLEISDCYIGDGFGGNLMVLANFPRLKEMVLYGTTARVIGDIRDIRPDDFPAIERLQLPATNVGGMGYEFFRISDVPRFIQAIYPLLKRSPLLFDFEWSRYHYDEWLWKFSTDSPDWYESEDIKAPFHLRFIRAGSRLGWTWFYSSYYCEINWLDPEPSRDSSDYETYIKELQRIEERIDFYKGCYQPPTEQEWCRRDDHWYSGREDWSLFIAAS